MLMCKRDRAWKLFHGEVGGACTHSKSVCGQIDRIRAEIYRRAQLFHSACWREQLHALDPSGVDRVVIIGVHHVDIVMESRYTMMLFSLVARCMSLIPLGPHIG